MDACANGAGDETEHQRVPMVFAAIGLPQPIEGNGVKQRPMKG